MITPYVLKEFLSLSAAIWSVFGIVHYTSLGIGIHNGKEKNGIWTSPLADTITKMAAEFGVNQAPAVKIRIFLTQKWVQLGLCEWRENIQNI